MDQPWYTFIVPKDQFVYYSVTKMKIWSNIRKKKWLVINVFINKGTDGEDMNHEKKLYNMAW